MPLYAYQCRCGYTEERFRAVRARNTTIRCAKCGRRMRRDIQAEQKPPAGELPDWVSVNAGVDPHRVQEANRYYADLGVRFDATGNAHVPGRNRRKFLKRRGMCEL